MLSAEIGTISLNFGHFLRCVVLKYVYFPGGDCIGGYCPDTNVGLFSYVGGISSHSYPIGMDKDHLNDLTLPPLGFLDIDDTGGEGVNVTHTP